MASRTKARQWTPAAVGGDGGGGGAESTSVSGAATAPVAGAAVIG